MLQRTQI